MKTKHLALVGVIAVLAIVASVVVISEPNSESIAQTASVETSKETQNMTKATTITANVALNLNELK